MSANIADIPDLEACSAFGETPNEALREVEIAKDAWLKAAKAEHKPIPTPSLSPRDLSVGHGVIMPLSTPPPLAAKNMTYFTA